MRLTEEEFRDVEASLTGPLGPQLMELMRRVTTPWPIDGLSQDVIQHARNVGWIDHDAYPTELGQRIGDPIRELLFWEERNKTVHFWGEVPVMVPETFDGKRVLSVGCGCGTNLFSLQAYAASVTGLELFPIYLQFTPLWAKLAEAELPRTVEGSAEAMPFAEGEFEVVVCLGALQYMNIKKVLSEIGRVLAPGGMAIITMSSLSGYLRFLRAQWSTFRKTKERFRELMTIANICAYPYIGRRVLVRQDTNIYPPRWQMRSMFKKVGLQLDDTLTCRMGEYNHEVCYVVRKR